jgi:hypothetical protein
MCRRAKGQGTAEWSAGHLLGQAESFIPFQQILWPFNWPRKNAEIAKSFSFLRSLCSFAATVLIYLL